MHKKPYPYLLALSLILAACGQLTEQAKDKDEKLCPNIIKSDTGQSVRWTIFPIKLVIQPGFPERLRPAIYQAAAKWNNAMGSTYFIVSKSLSKKESGLGDHQNTIYWKQGSGRTDENGSTELNFYRNHITEADIYIDGRSTDDLESVLIHEMGHVLGLEHSHDKTSIMYESLRDGEIRRNISQQEVSSIQCVYGGGE